MKSYRRLSAILLLLLFAGCQEAEQLTGPETQSLDGLELRLQLSKSTVEVGSTFSIMVEVENTTSMFKSFNAPNACFVVPRVTRYGEVQQGFGGILCAAVLTGYEIAPGDTLSFEFTFSAGNGFTTPFPGRYVVEADFKVSPELPTLRAPIDVVG